MRSSSSLVWLSLCAMVRDPVSLIGFASSHPDNKRWEGCLSWCFVFLHPDLVFPSSRGIGTLVASWTFPNLHKAEPCLNDGSDKAPPCDGDGRGCDAPLAIDPIRVLASERLLSPRLGSWKRGRLDDVPPWGGGDTRPPINVCRLDDT